MRGPLFSDPVDARRFISLIHNVTGLFASVQTQVLAPVGTLGVIDEASTAFRTTGSVRRIARTAIVSPAEDYVICSEDVGVNGFPYVAPKLDQYVVL